MKPRSELVPAIILIGVLVLLALVLVRPAQSAPAPQPGQIDVTGGDYGALSVAVSRIFGARALPGMDDGRSDLRVGDLPPDLPFEVIVPPGMTVVGSLSGEIPGEAQMVMDSNRPPDELFAMYVSSFEAQGFVRQPEGRMFSVFVPDEEDANYNAAFCRSRDSVLANLNVSQQPGKPTAVWLYTYWNVGSVSCLATDPSGVIGVGMSLLPTLKMPPGVVVHGGGSGGSADEGMASADSDLDLMMSPAQLSEYLIPQMEAAGWVLTGSASSDYGAWSTWTLKDAEGHPWDGALIIVASPVSTRQTVRLEVRRQ